MLSKSDTIISNTNSYQKQVGSNNKISVRLIRNDSLLDRVAKSVLNTLLDTLLLFIAIKQDKLVVLVKLELGVRAIKRVEKVFNFSHIEFPAPEEAHSRRNFVSETKTNLRGSERHARVVEVQEFVEINEHTLRCLRAEVANYAADWAEVR